VLITGRDELENAGRSQARFGLRALFCLIHSSTSAASHRPGLIGEGNFCSLVQPYMAAFSYPVRAVTSSILIRIEGVGCSKMGVWVAINPC
jgi:hypothetical protein